MAKMTLPEARHWEDFWGRRAAEKFTKASWSKKRIIRVLSSYVVAGQNALDAGCGSGFFSKFFCDRGLNTVSLDYSQNALDRCQDATEGRSRVVRADMVHDDLRKVLDEGFDIIFTDGLFEHFSASDQDRIVQNLTGVLKRDGYLVTVVPNRWSPWELIRPFMMPGIEETPFILRQLQDLNVRNGLGVIESGGVNTLPFLFSPDKIFGRWFGMLLYSVSQKNV